MLRSGFRMFTGLGAIVLCLATPVRARDTAAGERPQAFNVCLSCHTEVKGRNGYGPSLFGVVGRKAGSLPGFAYSGAMQASGLVWDEATLDAFIASPRTTVKGTRMPYGGMKDPEKRRQIIAYLKRLHD